MASRRRRPLSPAMIVRRNALYLGVFGNSRLWRTIAILVYGRRVARRVLGKTPELVARETLKPGQWLRIAALPQATRHDRERFRRTS